MGIPASAPAWSSPPGPPPWWWRVWYPPQPEAPGDPVRAWVEAWLAQIAADQALARGMGEEAKAALQVRDAWRMMG